MVRKFELSTIIPISRDAFWALRSDFNFDAFCAEQEKCTFTLESQQRTTDQHGNEFISIETDVSADESPLPTALQPLMGAKKFSLRGKARWWLHLHDIDHKACFESSPRIMSQRLTIRGQSWLEPTSSPDSCRCCYQIEIEVKVPALSSFLEQGLEKRMA